MVITSLFFVLSFMPMEFRVTGQWTFFLLNRHSWMKCRKDAAPPPPKLNHCCHNLRIWTLFLFFFFFAYQDSSPRRFAEPTCLSLSNKDLHVTAFRAINASVLPAFTTNSGRFPSELSRLTGPLNNLLK